MDSHARPVGKPVVDPSEDGEDEKKAHALVGRRLSGYTLEQVIGVGGMGAVYEARDADGREVAVKTLLPQYNTSEGLVRRFLAEAEAASAIGHPSIVEVLETGHVEGVHFLALELLKGRDFGDAIEDGELTLGEIWKIGVEVLDALEAAHEAGIVHRDIKPENVYLHEHEHGFRVKLLDFGIAKRLGPAASNLTVTGTVLGTPHFMSPEQAAGGKIDHRADLWSVGAMLFRALAGFPPYDAENYNVLISRILTELPPKMADVRPGLPAVFIRSIDGALRPEREQRFLSAYEMQRALARDVDLTGIAKGQTIFAPWEWAPLRWDSESVGRLSNPDMTVPDFDDLATEAAITPFAIDHFDDDETRDSDDSLEFAATVQAAPLTMDHEEPAPRRPPASGAPSAVFKKPTPQPRPPSSAPRAMVVPSVRPIPKSSPTAAPSTPTFDDATSRVALEKKKGPSRTFLVAVLIVLVLFAGVGLGVILATG